jgi:hypothetical protein
VIADLMSSWLVASYVNVEFATKLCIVVKMVLSVDVAAMATADAFAAHAGN